MATNRSRRPRDDEDDEDDRPRRRRDEDDDEDDRPRSRRRRDDDEEDEDDRPRRRRRYEDDDDDDRPRRRPRPKRKAGGLGAGPIVGLIVGGLVLVGIVVAVVMLAGGSADISYEKFQAIGENDTIEGLEKKFGSAKKIGPGEWGRTYFGGSDRPLGTDGSQSSPLSQYNSFAREVTAWYQWRNGKEELYVAEGTDFQGRQGPVVKIYWNPKLVEDTVRNPGGPKPTTPWWHVLAIGGPGEIRFGGSR